MNNIGTIELGKVANLLLVDDNPLIYLNTLQKPYTVFVKGRKLNSESLNNFEERAKNRKNLTASAIRYIENLLFEKYL